MTGLAPARVPRNETAPEAASIRTCDPLRACIAEIEAPIDLDELEVHDGHHKTGTGLPADGFP